MMKRLSQPFFLTLLYLLLLILIFFRSGKCIELKTLHFQDEQKSQTEEPEEYENRLSFFPETLLINSSRDVLIFSNYHSRRKRSSHITSFHKKRHSHTVIPSWLKKHIHQSYPYSQISIEEGIADVFREVAYGKQSAKHIQKHSVSSGNRYERKTAHNSTPDYVYVADENLPLSGRRHVTDFASAGVVSQVEVNTNATTETTFTTDERVGDNSDLAEKSLSVSISFEEPTPINNSESEYDEELYKLYEANYSYYYSDDDPEVTRSDSLLGNTTVEVNIENSTVVIDAVINKLPIPNLSWFDYLLCTNRNMTWMLVNFLLGVLLLGVSIFAPYRLLTLRSCTHILPRTHFVTVHLLVFVSVSLKALYMFHLAFGGKERLPLVLILILTNTGIPCFISAYLILIIMMFLTADVQLYKPKMLTMHNISIFIVMMIVLSFVADIIVGSAHSKSVLILSRIMLVLIALVIIAFYGRKHSRVLQVVQSLKREFQGELKLLVVPSKDSPQQKQMDLKHILRNRLGRWCQSMKVSTGALAVCCLIHFIQSVFLISSYVPSWAWWSFHASSATVEATLGIFLCIVAAFTQRYDENANIISNLIMPTILFKNKRRAISKERNGTVIYQRVSYSSGTESTQYTSCPTEVQGGTPVLQARSPKPPKRRTATVRRSATFSYAPQYPRGPGRPCQPPVPNVNIMRAGSASQIPIYTHGSTSRLSDIYSPASISHVPVYSPSSVKSMLVHEDGFVRIKSQADRNERQYDRDNSRIEFSDQFHVGSNSQLQSAYLQHWEGLGNRDNFYNCLPRKRRTSRSSSFHQHNSPIAERDYHFGSSGQLHDDARSPLQEPFQRTIDPNYHSFSRRRHGSRDLSSRQLNNIERDVEDPNITRVRRSSSRGFNLQHMNNLDRSEEDYQRLARRKYSHDDNSDPIYCNSLSEHSFAKFSDIKTTAQPCKISHLNVKEKVDVNPKSTYCESPLIKHKISNLSSSPVRNLTAPIPVHNSVVAYSPSISRREAHYPKPMSHRGSTASLKLEDIPYIEHYQRTNPVRRNHSSAGYFPSKYLLPPESPIDEIQRYGSLRLGIVKKRQPGYVLQTNTSKLINKYMEKYPRSASEENNYREGPSEYGVPNIKPKASRNSNQINVKNDVHNETIKEGDDAEGDTSQRAANKSKGSDTDWALELITSSSMLTDFYSLKRPKKEDKGEG
ncbi:hypothetical protein SK128_007188 [Halocaridina rubra]|uniref:Proline-rich transmembrane protein 3/4 domain-containing protein n=1 Tax=Halocaridina rubra TaxID=373956 RepID=A0AAN8X547_HALRR